MEKKETKEELQAKIKEQKEQREKNLSMYPETGVFRQMRAWDWYIVFFIIGAITGAWVTGELLNDQVKKMNQSSVLWAKSWCPEKAHLLDLNQEEIKKMQEESWIWTKQEDLNVNTYGDQIG